MINIFIQTFISFFYKNLLKPIIFLMPPEYVHDRVISLGRILGKFSFTRNLLKRLFVMRNSTLIVQIKDVEFLNPIGLSAGFDKDGKLGAILPSIGFGHAEIGSVTIKPYDGNPKPRLHRLKKSKSIWVNYGLKNDGTRIIIDRLEQDVQQYFVYGLSIAKTNSIETCDDDIAIQDYLDSFKLAVNKQFLKYITINISCPNTFGGEPFSSVDKLRKLLNKLDQIERTQLVFIKMPISIDDNDFMDLLEEISIHKVDGIVIGNLQKKKTGEYIKDKFDDVVISKGGLSGKPTFHRSNELIKLAYKNFGQKFVIVGCGGVFSGEDAYEKIRLGASLIQMITGLIFEGPSVVAKINIELAKLVERDGFASVRDVVGIDAKI
jgi:dihydroorotate dehydrogenase subfamily 2